MERLNSWVNSISSICHKTEQNLYGYRPATANTYKLTGSSISQICSPINTTLDSSYVKNWDDQITQSTFETLIVENQKSYKEGISTLTEKLGYVEAKYKILDKELNDAPRVCDRLESDISGELSKIQQELAELAGDDDLSQLSQLADQTIAQQRADMQSELDDVAAEMCLIQPQIYEEIQKTSPEFGLLESLPKQVGKIGEDMLSHFSTEQYGILDDIRNDAANAVKVEAKRMECALDRYRTDVMEEITNTLNTTTTAADAALKSNKTTIKFLKSALNGNTDNDEPSFIDIQDNLDLMSATAAKENACDLSILSEIQTQHEDTMVAISDLHTKLDVLSEQKAEGRHETHEGTLEICDRIDIVSAKIDRVESEAGRYAEMQNDQNAQSTKQSILNSLEEKMENMIDKINAIESSWMENTTPMYMQIPPELTVKDEKEATFGKDKRPQNAYSDLMTISLNDYGESDTESVVDFLSPKDSPLSRLPGGPGVFNFNVSNIPQIEEEEESEDLQSEEEIDIKDVTTGLFERVLKEELGYCMGLLKAG